MYNVGVLLERLRNSRVVISWNVGILQVQRQIPHGNPRCPNVEQLQRMSLLGLLHCITKCQERCRGVQGGITSLSTGHGKNIEISFVSGGNQDASTVDQIVSTYFVIYSTDYVSWGLFNAGVSRRGCREGGK